MKWYEIEYSGGGSSKSIIGQANVNLDEVLNTFDPKFIKIENISYYSKLSEKYELFEKWDSKWENEMWINTSRIISIRKIKGDLLSHASIGEWTAFLDKTPFSIIVSKQFADSNRSEFENTFLNSIEQLISENSNHFNFYGSPRMIEQELLSQNEFIITQYGNVVIRKKVNGNIGNEILAELIDYFSKSNQEKEDD